MKLLIAPDSFKGTLSAPQAATIMARAFCRELPIERVTILPLGDGGEGTADALIAAGAREEFCATIDGYGNAVTVRYAIIDGTSAVIDSASVVPMTAPRREPAVASSFGLGTAVKDAIGKGCRSVAIALGGTGSNDGGCGLAAALGVRFFDRSGQSFVPCGNTLGEIADYDVTDAAQLLDGIAVRGLCDVDNPFYGPRGAARVFAPQKGADEATAALLDRGMHALAELILKKTGFDLQAFAGAGAAGGLGGGIAAFLGGTLASGIRTVLELLRFEERAKEADLILTGEGCTDQQTLMGKAIMGVLNAAGSVPVVILSGLVKEIGDALYEKGAAAVCGTNRVAAEFSEVAEKAEQTLFAEAVAAARLIATGRKLAR